VIIEEANVLYHYGAWASRDRPQGQFVAHIAGLSFVSPSTYGLPAATATELAGLAIVLPVKMLITSWCAALDAKMSAPEINELAKVVRTRRKHYRVAMSSRQTVVRLPLRVVNDKGRCRS
jgi:hypothetical protein